ENGGHSENEREQPDARDPAWYPRRRRHRRRLQSARRVVRIKQRIHGAKHSTRRWNPEARRTWKRHPRNRKSGTSRLRRTGTNELIEAIDVLPIPALTYFLSALINRSLAWQAP